MVDENHASPGRRSFVRKFLGIVAIGGLAQLFRSQPVERAYAISNITPMGTNGTSGSFVGVDNNNQAYDDYCVITGGQDNAAGISGDGSTSDQAYATVCGGLSNKASAAKGTVVGGRLNTAGAVYATVVGGFSNTASGAGAFIGGGGYDGGSNSGNVADGIASTVAGGAANTASLQGSTVGGGSSNTADGSYSTVAGGNFNKAGGGASTVAGGYNNQATGSDSVVGGGAYHRVGGSYSTVPGGYSNAADATRSFAAGSNATVLSGHHGSIVFSDDSTADYVIPFNSMAANEFAVRAIGGVRLVTGVDASGYVTQQVAVSASGFLGVSTSGPSTPSYALDLRTPGSSSAQMHISPADADSGGYLTSANAGNLFMSAGATWNGSAWVAKNSTAYQYGGGAAGVRFFFDTGLTVGSTYTPTTRMFIGPTGHVGIGMSTAPAHLLQLGLDDAAKPSTNTWTIASDGRLKDPESIEPFTEGSELIKRLPQPVWFRYRKDSGLPSDRRVAGWVAQDIAPVAPFMIRRTKQQLRETDKGETETLSLNTNELPYAMLNTLKEMLQWKDKMTARVEEKDQEVSALKARLEKLEREDLNQL